MAQEFFNDTELAQMRTVLRLLIGDLETLHSRTADFSKQRLRKRLEGIQNDVAVVVKSLPEDK